MESKKIILFGFAFVAMSLLFACSSSKKEIKGEASSQGISTPAEPNEVAPNSPGKGETPTTPGPPAAGESEKVIAPVDSDKDNVFDDVDNCIAVANSDQKDFDGDKLGDACDLLSNGLPVGIVSMSVASLTVGDSGLMEASFSDPEGLPLSFQWSVLTSPTDSLGAKVNPLQETIGSKIAFHALAAGKYVMRLQVSDAVNVVEVLQTVLVQEKSATPAPPAAINQIPVIQQLTLSPASPIEEGQQNVVLTLKASDADVGDELEFSLEGIGADDPVAFFHKTTGHVPAGAAVDEKIGLLPTKAGSFAYRVVVKDLSQGQEKSKTEQVFHLEVNPKPPVIPPNHPPTIVLVSDPASALAPGKTVNENVPVDLIVTATDSDGDTHFSVNWTLVTAPQGIARGVNEKLTAKNADLSTMTFKTATAGVYQYQLSVSDGKKQDGTATFNFQIVVVHVNQPPVFAFSKTPDQLSYEEGNEITLNATLTDPEEGVLPVVFTVKDASTNQPAESDSFSLDTTNPSAQKFKGLKPGNFVLSFAGTDREGLSCTEGRCPFALALNFDRRNQSPVLPPIILEPIGDVLQGTSVTLDACAARDPDPNTNLTIRFVYQPGAGQTLESLSDTHLSQTACDADDPNPALLGKYTLSVGAGATGANLGEHRYEVSASDGRLTATQPVTIKVIQNKSPTIHLDVSPSSGSIENAQEVEFDAGRTDDERPATLAFEWTIVRSANSPVSQADLDAMLKTVPGKSATTVRKFIPNFPAGQALNGSVIIRLAVSDGLNRVVEEKTVLLQDNCPGILNPDQTDSDHDGLGNVCDPTPLPPPPTPPATPPSTPVPPPPPPSPPSPPPAPPVIDTDRDGIPDTRDNCPTVSNANQANNDRDALGDACDPDDDNDGKLDTADNCPLVSNADQFDMDGDRIGNACDPDMDNDGKLNGSDNCPLVSNPLQLDLDGDGFQTNGGGDKCDFCNEFFKRANAAVAINYDIFLKLRIPRRSSPTPCGLGGQIMSPQSGPVMKINNGNNQFPRSQTCVPGAVSNGNDNYTVAYNVDIQKGSGTSQSFNVDVSHLAPVDSNGTSAFEIVEAKLIRSSRNQPVVVDGKTQTQVDRLITFGTADTTIPPVNPNFTSIAITRGAFGRFYTFTVPFPNCLQ